MDLEIVVTTFLLGVAIGIAIHRFIMALVLEKSPDTLCGYCEWLRTKRNRHKK